MSKSFFRRLTKRFFIVVNIIAAILFLLGSYGYLFNPKYFWPIGFLTLSAFYILLILVAFIIFWLFIKPARALISVVALLVAYKPISNIIPYRFSHAFNKVKPENALRVMTWNVAQFDVLNNKKHPEVRNRMFNVINEYEPDIACFQEMVGSDSIDKAINYIPYFLRQLNMADYFYSYNRKLDFDNNHHFGVIIFSKYPIVFKKTVSYPPHDYNSIFQYIDILKDNDTVRVFNLHLQSLKFSNRNLQYIEDPSIKDEQDLKNSKNIISKFKKGFLKRESQSNRIKEEINKSPYPVIVSGDFNDVPNSYSYNTIGKGLHNAFAEKGTGIGRTYNGISPTLRIDNIFADTRFSITQYIRIQKKLSDHFPIIADMYLKK